MRETQTGTSRSTFGMSPEVLEIGMMIPFHASGKRNRQIFRAVIDVGSLETGCKVPVRQCDWHRQVDSTWKEILRVTSADVRNMPRQDGWHRTFNQTS